MVWLAKLLSAVVAFLGILAPTPPGASARLPLIFNDPLHSEGPGVTNYTAVELARAASDIAPRAILRFTVSWEGVQPYCLDAFGHEVQDRAACVTPGPYNWNWYQLKSDLDSISGYLHAGRVRLLPVVAYAPSWARGYEDSADPYKQPGYDPEYPDMPPGGDPTALRWWRQFNAALVSWMERRYGRASLAGLEVWNEEDQFPATWSLEPDVTTTMADRYSRVLCSAFSAVRSVDPTLPVIFGGIAALDAAYLRAAYASPAADIRKCMTAIAIHPYDYVRGRWVAPTTLGSPFAFGASIQSLVAATDDDGGRPIWITEFGYPASGVGEQVQAAWDAEAYTLASALPHVVMMGIHTIFDQPGGFQICARPGSPLPAANELKRAVSGNPSTVASC